MTARAGRYTSALSLQVMCSSITPTARLRYASQHQLSRLIFETTKLSFSDAYTHCMSRPSTHRRAVEVVHGYFLDSLCVFRDKSAVSSIHTARTTGSKDNYYKPSLRTVDLPWINPDPTGSVQSEAYRESRRDSSSQWRHPYLTNPRRDIPMPKRGQVQGKIVLELDHIVSTINT